jgi:hypothetical protein
MNQVFIDKLRAGKQKRVFLQDLRRYWLEMHPEQGHHPNRDELLLAALKQLEAKGELSLPAKGSFEKLGNPAMPKFVTLLSRPKAKPSEDWSRISWLPELGFWTNLSESELFTASAINDWLRQRRGKFLRVPLRERSLEIFGDEKYLDSRVRNNALFSGRLPLAALGTFQVPHPLPCRAANAPGRPILVVENHHTYWSLAEWNSQARRYAGVVYGAGKAFCASGQALQEAMRECSAEGALYFGDIDPAGILIPYRFNGMKGPTVQPDIGLYRYILANGRRRSSVIKVNGSEKALRQWLPELSTQISELWADDQWIPQENLGTEQLWGDSVFDLERERLSAGVSG